MTQITFQPTDARLDELVHIQVTGADPGAPLRLRLRCEAFKAEAIADFLADGAGTVDVSSQAPASGDYEGVDPAGLFWSARFDEDGDLLGMVAALARLEPLVYTATLESGGTEIARAGHWACLPPYLPTTRSWSFHPLVPIPLAYGGDARGTAAGSAAMWPRVKGFLNDHLAATADDGE